MAFRWTEILRSHAKLATSMARDIRDATGRSDLTLDQAQRLHAIAERGVSMVKQLISDMNMDGAGEQELKVAASLSEIWGGLSSETALKLREMQELTPLHAERD